MQSFKQVGSLFLYLLGAIGYVASAAMIVGISVLIKFVALMLADKILYTIFIIGDLLRGIEVIELLNILVFAFIGMGFGLATRLLKPEYCRQVSAILLILIVPFVFMSTPIIRYNSWLDKVEESENLSPDEATKITNLFLKKQIGVPGFFGYYLYTGQFPVIPTTQSQMKDLDSFEKKVNSRFVQLTGAAPTIVSWSMLICFWLIRLFYFAIAVIATIAHFRQGVVIARR
ncbi:MAG: hypothetical protein EAZ78_13235 [Oscillatoriales cyanobacterium]|uniref:Uncharacterized protein n=1 Tax=Microcoleus anatoxicus PTRS2 TaxID=2705321 RepID=A0ABU8YGT3_9CYAN|nr:MAG: hypothetical protein EA000_14835 [Oscillatoriales cyanobacterium]TAD98437.1 MAG: hypothetical protein EAZ98_06700 [Oscillatoriales cyanobacterium]TAE06366.1 MAG: hypothetical protein EAZ96_02455 [Oscillatoriales cyanobacterium]TAF03173.1 MAG: hypothetical protein EAZ78_13235 [Oscillatoriales cyanobacterium]TAF45883.1 MAG: hypothetical protein EAZ68_04440 [Oscillatoriales cyanobacterium]